MPVLFGFHGCGGQNYGDGQRTEYTDFIEGNVFGSEYVVAIPLSSSTGGCWSYGQDMPRVKELYDDLVNNYCVDLDRVYATGHSSGAQFIVEMLKSSHSADAAYLKFAGMAPVAASNMDNTTPMPVMYIQGENDTVRGGSGKDVVDDFVDSNMCAAGSMPYAGVDGCQSDNTQVDPGCIVYDECSVPTVWCSHNDPAYTNTSHGIPCFAAQGMDFFFKSLE